MAKLRGEGELPQRAARQTNKPHTEHIAYFENLRGTQRTYCLIGECVQTNSNTNELSKIVFERRD